ncbi:MAG: hypothetical protein ABIO45_00480 [Burkholderiaceae bacterium]
MLALARVVEPEALDDFWTTIGEQLPSGAVTTGDPDTLRLSTPARWLFDWAGHFTPAQLNPLEMNPLRDLLASRIDFEGLRPHSPLIKLFIGTPRARTAQLRVSCAICACSRVLPTSSGPRGRTWVGVERRLAQMRFHLIDNGDVAILKAARHALCAHGPFPARLREQCQERGAAWLASHLPAVGRRALLDIAAPFGA